jgi:hypothetical protein
MKLMMMVMQETYRKEALKSMSPLRDYSAVRWHMFKDVEAIMAKRVGIFTRA